MRIAQVAPPWVSVPPKGYGGIELVVALLADGLAERGHNVTLFATGDSETTAELEYAFENAPGPAFIDSLWHETLHQLHVHRDLSRFDLLHLHTPWSGMVAALVHDLPVVHTLHGTFTPQMRQLYQRLADRVTFVAISEAQRAQMPELDYGGVVYNGIDVPAYPFREEKEDFLLFLGRSSPDKGTHLAVEAARAAGLPLVMAVKVVHPLEREHWAKDVEPRLPEGTRVFGELDFDEKADLLSRTRALLFPIDWAEPFGLVMTEAMACGTPVIATPRGAVPEVVDDGTTGFVVSVEDYPQEAAGAIRRLGEIDPSACRMHVEKRFSKEAMVSGYDAVFERAAG